MDEWAKEYGEAVSFCCVSCAGPGLALQFAREMKLRFCTNGFIANKKHMPRWGQLGCSGFIIFDENLKVVTRKTKAFLEVREAAFREVRQVVDRMLEDGAKRKVEISEEEKARRQKARTQPCYHDNWQPSTRAADDSSSAPQVPKVKSVGVEKMDAEHKACEAALAGLLKYPTYGSLDTVHKEFAAHFKSEESLLDETVYVKCLKTTGSGFDVAYGQRKSHFAEHQRILALIDGVLSPERIQATSVKTLKLKIKEAGLSWKDCVTKAELHKRAQEGIARKPIKPDVVRQIFSTWEDHEKYDQGYVPDLTAALASHTS